MKVTVVLIGYAVLVVAVALTDLGLNDVSVSTILNSDCGSRILVSFTCSALHY